MSKNYIRRALTNVRDETCKVLVEGDAESLEPPTICGLPGENGHIFNPPFADYEIVFVLCDSHSADYSSRVAAVNEQNEQYGIDIKEALDSVFGEEDQLVE